MLLLLSIPSNFDQDIISGTSNDAHGAFFVPIILGSDKTTVSVATGNNEYWPVYLSIGNLHNSTRRTHRNGLVVIGFLSTPKGKFFLCIHDPVLNFFHLNQPTKNIVTVMNFASSGANSFILHYHACFSHSAPPWRSLFVLSAQMVDIEEQFSDLVHILLTILSNAILLRLFKAGARSMIVFIFFL